MLERERQRQPSLSRRNYCWSWMVPLWQAACGCTAERIPCRRGQGLAGVPAAWLGWGDGGAGGGCRASCWAAVSGRSSHPAGFPCLSTQLVQSSVDLLTHWCIFFNLRRLISSKKWGEHKLLVHLICISYSWIRNLNTKCVRLLWNNLGSSEPRE